MNRTFSDIRWIWWREMRHFTSQKVRISLTFIQPLIWLAFMGNMFQKMASIPGFPAPTYLDYMAPGVVVMVSLFGGVFGGMSIVWDRRFGYLQKLLAAPIARSAVVLGKMLAIATQTSAQSLIILSISLLLGVRFRAGPAGLLPFVLLVALAALAFAGISLSLGAVLTSHETLLAVTNFLTLPLMFTSNAMMPTNMMPIWLARVARLNPLSYAVSPLRFLFLRGCDWPGIATGVVVLGISAAILATLATTLFRRNIA